MSHALRVSIYDLTRSHFDVTREAIAPVYSPSRFSMARRGLVPVATTLPLAGERDMCARRATLCCGERHREKVQSSEASEPTRAHVHHIFIYFTLPGPGARCTSCAAEQRCTVDSAVPGVQPPRNGTRLFSAPLEVCLRGSVSPWCMDYGAWCPSNV